MTDKEKLARMLEQTIAQIGGFGVPRSDARRMAADLMHNGVTVQELEGCKHCIDGKTIETDIDGEIEIVKIIPLPAIDLVTGEQERKAASPYWAMRLLLDGGEDFVRIHFCPLCGRRLPQPPKGE